MDGAIAERAWARGEVSADTRPGEVIEAVLGPIYFRLLVTGEPVDEDYVRRVVDGSSTEPLARPRVRADVGLRNVSASRRRPWHA